MGGRELGEELVIGDVGRGGQARLENARANLSRRGRCSLQTPRIYSYATSRCTAGPASVAPLGMIKGLRLIHGSVGRVASFLFDEIANVERDQPNIGKQIVHLLWAKEQKMLT